MKNSALNVAIGDKVVLRKPHPCGSDEWLVDGVGADIRLVCTTCGRRVMLDREIFERRLRLVIPAHKPDEETLWGD